MTIFVICVGSSLLSKATDVTYIYADRNVRPWTIQGYTLATFPKVVQYILCTTREEIGERTLHVNGNCY